MRIAIHTLGTRGDVQPFLALAVGLVKAGHEVSLATAGRYRNWIMNHGVAFAELPGDLLDLMDTPAGKRVLSGSNAWSARVTLFRSMRRAIRRQLDAQWEATAAGADAIIHHPKALAGRHIAERLNIPAFISLPIPALTPTSAFPSPLIPFADLGPFNPWSHRLIAAAPDLMFGKELRDFRKRLGLSGLRSRFPQTTLYAYSPAVVPTPADFRGDAVVCGYWHPDDGRDWTPPEDLAAFLEAGPSPVYVGFGSIPSGDPRKVTSKVVAALGSRGLRGVLATGWGGLDPGAVPPGIHVLDEAPHDWLFPRMAAVVHHGGSGTVAAGLRAGRPTVVCPIFGDQPFWARRIRRLGVGPDPIPFARLSASALADAMEIAVTDSTMRRRASALGETLRAERGVDNAVRVIERRIADFRPRE